MDDLSMYVPNVHFEQIPIKNLVSDQEYQRNLSIKHVRKAAENFDLYQINPVKVSRRNGINYVFNDCSITKNELKFLGNTEFSCQKVYNKCMENS